MLIHVVVFYNYDSDKLLLPKIKSGYGKKSELHNGTFIFHNKIHVNITLFTFCSFKKINP